jgi:hypothetical protein
VEGCIYIRTNADVILKRRHEPGESDLNRIQARAEPLTHEDPVLIGKQLDSAATGKFRRKPDAGTHLRAAGGICYKTSEFSEVVRRKRRARG